ncbi:response regulator transcription factor [Paenibacillus silvae]|uniref:Alkaline phosphatase synthesis transcriptional regulatory protein PhoP n=1 Tax=Paenibacillus silvae TaxID=1325358 RepID=A0ABQ1ZJ90_9BACL|nr:MULTISPECIES: response regulator transcription factor [Paenibacillus]MCK6075951.1 response regulator transcription factor [Paenibacillus silvae]MCK6150340.1 response regulator transcription factor [Paenibacillus silvae]MCK6268638.1 response regulator transcription factor [Paenibacillus silvae]GGH66297.1 alkaline phosphatase synthesis transcriptional regulatory protein PhoP [Paenibacillus silvae]
MNRKVLVVDDESSIVSAIAYALRREGYEVETANDGEEALVKVASFHPQVMILDVMMPKLDGYGVCRRLEDREDIGIILLTVKNELVDKIVGLEMGADDYMTKPFEIRELLARVKALMRRVEKKSQPPQDNTQSQAIVNGALRIHVAHRTVMVGEEKLDLTPKEFDLLTILMSNPERVYTRDDLLDRVWGMEYAGGTRTVDIHIQRLRKKIGDTDQQMLQTVYGIGYKAAATETGGHL